jgi:hypothetical protein
MFLARVMLVSGALDLLSACAPAPAPVPPTAAPPKPTRQPAPPTSVPVAAVAGATATASTAVAARANPLLPTYLPSVGGPKPDFASKGALYEDAFATYPANPVKALPAEPPGLGSNALAMAPGLYPPPTPMAENPAWKEINKRLNVTFQFNVQDDMQPRMTYDPKNSLERIAAEETGEAFIDRGVLGHLDLRSESLAAILRLEVFTGPVERYPRDLGVEVRLLVGGNGDIPGVHRQVRHMLANRPGGRELAQARLQGAVNALLTPGVEQRGARRVVRICPIVADQVDIR